mgnify:CR=1 FL=1
MNTFPNDAKATFEHWYAEVMEGYHLIGLHNSSDLEKMLIWARAHESESKDMARKHLNFYLLVKGINFSIRRVLLVTKTSDLLI